MNDKEKKRLAKVMLKRNGYNTKDIKKILRHMFGDEQDKEQAKK